MSGCPNSTQKITVNNATQGIAFINKRPPGYISNCPDDNLMFTGIELCEIKVMGILQFVFFILLQTMYYSKQTTRL